MYFGRILQYLFDSISSVDEKREFLKKAKEADKGLIQNLKRLALTAECLGFVQPIAQKSVPANYFDSIFFICTWMRDKSLSFHQAVMRRTQISQHELKLYKLLEKDIYNFRLKQVLGEAYPHFKKSFISKFGVTPKQFFSSDPLIFQRTEERLLISMHMKLQNATQEYLDRCSYKEFKHLLQSVNRKLRKYKSMHIFEDLTAGGFIRLFIIVAPYLERFFQKASQDHSPPKLRTILAETYNLLLTYHVRGMNMEEISDAIGQGLMVNSPCLYGFPISPPEYNPYFRAQIALLNPDAVIEVDVRENLFDSLW